LAWTGLAKWGTQLLSWASTFLVARLLTPTDYGIAGMATVYLGLVQLVSEFGLGAALVQRRDISQKDISRLGGLSVLVGLALFAASAGVSPLIAGFFREPEVQLVVVVLASTFLITGLQVVPNSLLARDLLFKRLALIEGIAALTQTVVTFGLALGGARYWALVLGGVTGKTVATVLLLYSRPHRLAWPGDLRTLSSALTFGWRVVLTRLSWYVYSNADFAIIGRLLGTQSLGSYSFGWTIGSIPVDKVTSIVGRVAMPVLSAVQRERAAVARYLLLLSEGLALAILPASLGLSLVARDFVPVVLGAHWNAAIVPLQALAAHATFRCLLAPYGQALLALDETRQSVRVGILQVLVMPAVFYVAAMQWGIDGVAISWLVVHPVITIPPLLLYTLRRVDLPLTRLLTVLWPAISSAALMSAVVLGAQFVLWESPDAARLAVSVACGVLSYGGALLLLHGGRVRQLVSTVRALRAQ
jgi:PST family polysaccharide transporter